jgi:transcriptional regulator with XRE-family HTH domain
VPLPKEIVAELSRFGANVRRERTARNITQEKFAERADLNIRTLQKIEAGELNVLITTAARIQRALSCSWDKLMPSG